MKRSGMVMASLMVVEVMVAAAVNVAAVVVLVSRVMKEGVSHL